LSYSKGRAKKEGGELVDLIVDGYNALFDVALLEKEPEEFVSRILRDERENFIKVLSSARRNRGLTILVFDGQKDETKEERRGPLIVVFTSKGKTADDYIVDLVKGKEVRIGNDSIPLVDIVVLTGDQELKRRIRGAEVRKPRWFFPE
jgi:predicted RNA-binding protein with PIN domain